MTWIIYSLLLYVSSVALYLFVRKSQLLQIPQYFINLGMFLFPAFVFLVLTLVTQNSLAISWVPIVEIAVASFIFSYLGNFSSLLSIQKSPNPGYPLMISKSYVVFTSIAAVFLFSAPFSIFDAISIGCIVIFSALIIHNNKSKKDYSSSWLLYAFAAFFCWGCLALFSKFILNSGINVFVYLFYLHLFASVYILIELFYKRADIRMNFTLFPWILGIGLCSTLFNLFIQVGYTAAPNPGYINAVNASSISLLTLASSWIFKDELNAKKVIGIIGVTIGLVLLFVK